MSPVLGIRVMKPIYITDLDHTLLHSDHSIGEYTKKMWSSRVNNSILSIATARSFSKSREFLSKLELKYPLILLDGAMVVSPDKEPIDLKIISRDLGDWVIVEGAKFGIYPFVIGLKDSELNEAFYYTDILNSIQKSVLANYKTDPRLEYHRELRAMKMTLKIVYFGEKEVLYPLRNHLRDTFKDELEYKLSPENYTKGYFLTILHPKADKSNALLEVCNYLQRDISDVTVFGDGLNDIGMFDISGKSIAVNNALDEVKDRADIVLKHNNDEDGVARYIMSVR
jgi:Cof subfamily protein (haloacid dehalogenase superfamily)